MIEEEKIVAIIQAKLEGRLSKEEEASLKEYLEDPKQAEIYAQYEQIWSDLGALSSKQESFESNTAAAWSAIQDEIEVEQPKRKQKWAYWAAASVALIFTILGANYFLDTQNANMLSFTLAANENDTLTLSDGSMAYLYGPCTVSYPKEFSEQERLVQMDGMVYFDIAHDKSRSFEVQTKLGQVEVLGTSFIVDTRTEDQFVVQCLSGKVRMTAVKNGEKYESVLTRNQMATSTSTAAENLERTFEREEVAIQLPARKLSFENQPLRDIIERMEYEFGVSINVENKDLLNIEYFTSLNDSTLDDFLNELKITFKVDVTRADASTYILKGGNSN